MESIDFAGFKAMNAKSVPLEKIYIRLMARSGDHAINEHNLAKLVESEWKHSQKANKGKEYFEIEGLFQKITGRQSPRKLLILGKPGSGKTTMLKYMAIKAARQEGPFRSYTPVFIRLYEWIRLNNWESMKIKDNLKESSLTGGNRLRFFDKSAGQAKILYLFDGLDEIADEKIRRKAINWFQDMDFGENPVIITSRFTGLSEEKNLRFETWFIDNYLVMDMDDELIKEFCRNWFKIYETHVTKGRDEEQSLEDAEKNSQEMITDLFKDADANILSLARIPMLLTMIAFVYRQECRLPRDRHELYKRIIELMTDSDLFKFRVTRADYPSDKDVIIRHLASLARGLSEAKSRSTSLNGALEVFPEKFEGRDALYFLNQMIERIGLLYRSEGQIGFIHLSLQEYLTAHHFKTQETHPLDILLKHRESFWYEPIRLFFSSADDNLKKAFLEEVSGGINSERQFHKSMNLWEDCLDELKPGDFRKELEIDFGRNLLGKMLDMEETNDEGIWNTSLYYGFYLYPDEYIPMLTGRLSDSSHPYLRSFSLRLRIKAAKPEERLTILHESVKTVLEAAKKSESTSSMRIGFEYEALPRLVFISGDFLQFYKFLKNVTEYGLEYQCLIHDRLRSLRDLRDLRDFYQGLLGLTDEQTREVRKYINGDMTKLISRLRQLSPEQIREYFPNTKDESFAELKDLGWTG